MDWIQKSRISINTWRNDIIYNLPYSRLVGLSMLVMRSRKQFFVCKYVYPLKYRSWTDKIRGVNPYSWYHEGIYLTIKNIQNRIFLHQYCLKVENKTLFPFSLSSESSEALPSLCVWCALKKTENTQGALS